MQSASHALAAHRSRCSFSSFEISAGDRLHDLELCPLTDGLDFGPSFPPANEDVGNWVFPLAGVFVGVSSILETLGVSMVFSPFFIIGVDVFAGVLRSFGGGGT